MCFQELWSLLSRRGEAGGLFDHSERSLRDVLTPGPCSDK